MRIVELMHITPIRNRMRSRAAFLLLALIQLSGSSAYAVDGEIAAQCIERRIEHLAPLDASHRSGDTDLERALERLRNADLSQSLLPVNDVLRESEIARQDFEIALTLKKLGEEPVQVRVASSVL
jgi:hypothetical protein